MHGGHITDDITILVKEKLSKAQLKSLIFILSTPHEMPYKGAPEEYLQEKAVSLLMPMVSKFANSRRTFSHRFRSLVRSGPEYVLWLLVFVLINILPKVVGSSLENVAASLESVAKTLSGAGGFTRSAIGYIPRIFGYVARQFSQGPFPPKVQAIIFFVLSVCIALG